MPIGAFSREVLRLALPAFGALVAPSALLLSETGFIGSLGTDALAGYAGGAAAFGVATSLGYFLAYASTGTVARRLGAGQRREALTVGIDHIALGLVIGAIAGLALWIGAGTFVGWIGVEPQAQPDAIAWLHGAAFGTPAMMASMAAVGMFRGLQDTRVTFIVTVLQVVLNIALCALLILVAHLGTIGAGAALAIAETAGFCAYAIVLLRHVRAAGASARPTHLGALGEAFTAGLPLLWRGFALRTVLMGTTVVAARLGTHELAAFQVSLTFWYVLANLLDALAIAAQAMVGRRLGASEGAEARVVVHRLMRWALRYGVTVGIIVMALAPVLPALFSASDVVRHLITVALLLVGVHQPLAAIVFLLDGVLIGSGDARYLAFVLTMAMCTFLPLAWAVVHWGLGIAGLWGAMIAFLTTRGILMVRRARSGAWAIEGATR